MAVRRRIGGELDGNRAAAVIKRLRALFSKRELALEPLDLNDAAREVIALSANDLQRNSIILEQQLADDPVLYQAKCAACESVRPQFYDPSKGWAAAWKGVLDKTTGPGHPESAPRDWVPETAAKTP